MRRFGFLVQVVISVVCLAAVAIMVHPAEAWDAISRANPLALAAVFALMPAAILARAWRWRYILARQAMTVPLSTMYRVVFIASALNLFLPASMGDLASSYYGWRAHGNKEAMLASAMADKITGLLTLCLLGIACASAIGEWNLAMVTLAFTVPLAVVILFPRLIPWQWASFIFRKLFRKVLRADLLHQTTHLRLSTVGGAVAISVLGWVFTNLMYYFACLAFVPDVSIAYVFAVAPLINLMRVLPVTVSGLGSADMLIVFLFGLVGMANADAFAASMAVNLALLIVPGLIGLGFILSNRGWHARAPEENARNEIG